MTDSHPKTLLKQLNDSGFPFQLAVEQTIRQTEDRHRWYVLAAEAPWRLDDRTGWTDLLINRESVQLVIECKRMEADWIFVQAHGRRGEASTTNAVGPIPGSIGMARWAKLDHHPPSVEAIFCVAQGSKGVRLQLENLAADVVAAAEGHAIIEANRAPTTKAVIPTIVTTAKLHVAAFEPGRVPLGTGRLDDGSAEFREVPFVRFTKALGPRLTSGQGQKPAREYYADNRRTVIVIQADSLVDFLSRFDVL